MFRDETRKVVRKAKAKEIERNASPEEEALTKPSQPCSDRSPKVYSPQGDIGLVMRNPSPPIEDGAISFFFHRDASAPRTFSRGFLDILPAIYQKELNSRGPLPEIITAIGLAGFSNLQGAPDVMLAARVKHTAALRDVNAALHDPARAKADSTLMTVMLLGLFEVLTFSTLTVFTTLTRDRTSHAPLRSLCRHGLSILVERQRSLRFVDMANFSMILAAACSLIFEIRLQVPLIAIFIISLLTICQLIDCIQRRKAVPQVISDWSETAYNLQNEDELIEQQLFNIMARLCNVRHLIHTQAGGNPETVALAFSIDADLEVWAASLPSIYSYKIIAAQQGSHGTFGYDRHVYPNFPIAGAWNAWRSARILAIEAVIAWLMRYGERLVSTPEYIRCKLLQNKMSNDICASVSFYFEGTDNFRDAPYALKASAGISLLWPLYVVATAHHHTDARNVWIIKQLEKIAGVLGIRQAMVLANLLRGNRGITLWDREMSNRLDLEDENEDEW